MAKTMLEGIPKKEYPRLFYRYFKEFLEVLAGKTSLKLYLAYNYPSFYKPKFKEGEKLKWKGSKFKVPNACEYNLEMAYILGGMYQIPECHIEAEDVVFDVGAHFGFFSCYAVQKGAREVYAFEPNPYVFEILKKHAEMWSDKINLIKIDTEGSEREILKGAKETIRRFKPRMAIAAYHLPDDKKMIPKLVLSIRDDYKFKLVNKGEEDLFFF
jgi:hypothetical protein